MMTVEVTEHFTPHLYADMAEALTGKGAKQPTVGLRDDGQPLFYPATVNALVGAPESGKTLVALAVVADQIFTGKNALVVDLDHNGAQAIGERLRGFGVSVEQLTDPQRFRYSSPEDHEALLQVIREAELWRPDVVLVDSVGEVLPLFGAKSNDDTDYTRVHRTVFTAFANAGACVVLIDHEPKSRDSAEYGAAGTIAKKRAIDGVQYRVTVRQTFIPGEGGSASLSVLKDRHGAIRKAAARGGREPIAATFRIAPTGGNPYRFEVPLSGDDLAALKLSKDVELLKQLDPPPATVRDVKERMSWRSERASEALRNYRALEANS